MCCTIPAIEETSEECSWYDFVYCNNEWLFPVAARSKAWVYDRSVAYSSGSNPARDMECFYYYYYYYYCCCCKVEVSATG
jgi:hypothetical protein